MHMHKKYAQTFNVLACVTLLCDLLYFSMIISW